MSGSTNFNCIQIPVVCYFFSCETKFNKLEQVTQRVNQFGKYESEKRAIICNSAHHQSFPIVTEDISIDSIKLIIQQPANLSSVQIVTVYPLLLLLPLQIILNQIRWKVDPRFNKLKKKQTILWKRWNDSVSGFCCVKKVAWEEGNQRFRARLLSGSEPRARPPQFATNPTRA